MVNMLTVIKKFAQMGEKTGWSYVEIPQHIAQELKPNCKVSFRVKGMMDSFSFNGLALVPMGEGDFILPLKASIRKSLKKEAGAMLALQLQEDKEFKIEMPDDLHECLAEQDHMMRNFLNMPKSHQNYYINWINEAKTEHTRVKRLTLTVKAMDAKLLFDEMMRENKTRRING